MKNILRKSHELWLTTLMAAFMSRSGENKRVLYEFSDIFFRHFTWIENDLIKRGSKYDYDRDNIPIKVEKLKIILNNIIQRMDDIVDSLHLCEDQSLSKRISTDIKYIKSVLNNMDDEDIEAFSMARRYRDIPLDKEATDALTLFLFEESYKEYELIMIYNYFMAHSDDTFINRIFKIMIEESFFHLRSFCEMMAEMGILGVPRSIHKSLYIDRDLKEFLIGGIEEEIAAKEQCRELSEAVAKESEELASFFDFINHQEDYHVDLMREAVEHFEKGSANA